MNLETLENEHFSELNETDKEIIQFINRNRAMVRESSLAAVATESLFSKSSIFRVCQKLGLTGFSQLKYLLQEEANQVQDVNIDFVSQTVKSVLWMSNQFKSTKLEDMYKVLSDASTVFIYSTGWEQQIVAQQLQRNLYLAGKMAFSFPSAVDEMSLQRTHIDANDALIVISYSGMNETVLKMVQNFNLQGVKTIAFTSFRQNRLSQIASYNLYYDTVAKNVQYQNRKEQFFSDLHVLIDLFTMGLINYISKADSELED